MPRIAPVAAVPDLAEQAYQAILEAICDGRLGPGERLTQERLAENLAVSRQPVLQALQLLKREGLVQEAGGRGLVVAPLTARYILDLYQVRAVLDGLAAREAARRRAQLPAALLEDGRRAARENAIAAMIGADLAFHRAIYGAAGNPVLQQSAERHWNHIRRVMGAVLQRAESRAAIWDEHEAICAAIAAGDAGQAQALAIAHCEHAGASLAQKLELAPADSLSSLSSSSPHQQTGDKHEAEPGAIGAIRA